MKSASYLSRPPSGFTLVEILVAIAVLAILVLMINTLFSGASLAISTSRHHMDADSEARLVFARMGTDFAGMVKRTDVDQLFAQETSNDGMWFYSQAAAVYNSALEGVAPDPKSPIALVGYRVAIDQNGDANNGRYQLERVGQGLAWDTQNGQYQEMVLLTPPATPSTTDVWDPASTLGGAVGGAFPNSIGVAPYDTYSSANNSYYHVLGPDVFRIEYCFLLKDGTYSNYPVEWNSTLYTRTTTSPNSTTPSSSVAVGWRWVNSTTGQTYICTSAPTGGVATFSGTGMQDVAAIVVAIAILDNASQQIVTPTKLNNISDALLTNPTEQSLEVVPPPATPIQLAAQLWQTTITSGTFAQTAGIPTLAAAQVRVYQRYFYLNP